LIAGHVPVTSTTLTTAATQIKAGRARALAVSSAKRVPEFPEVQTFAEMGYPELTASIWFSLSGPAGVAPEIVSRLNAEVRRALQRVAVVRQERGVRPALSLPRLEVRRERPVRGPAVGARGIGHAQGNQAEVLSGGRAGRRGVDLHGTPGAEARAARAGVGDGVARAALPFQAPAGDELPAGDRGRDRFQPRVLPAFRRARNRSAVQGQQGQ